VYPYWGSALVTSAEQTVSPKLLSPDNLLLVVSN
jgi:hypothetical protein